jgi:hypothetical protein
MLLYYERASEACTGSMFDRASMHDGEMQWKPERW